MPLRNRNTLIRKIGHKMCPLDVSQWLRACAFMCLWWRPFWVIQFWDGYVRKRSLCYAEKPAAILERMPSMGKQAGMKERTHQLSPGVGATRPVSVQVVRGRRDVGEGVVSGSSLLSHCHLAGIGKCWNHPNHQFTHKVVCIAGDSWDGEGLYLQLGVSPTLCWVLRKTGLLV